MQMLSTILLYYVSASGLILLVHRYYRHAFISLAMLFLYLGILGCFGNSFRYCLFFCFQWILPLFVISLVCHAALIESEMTNMPKKYQARFQLRNGVLNMKNIRRGVSIIGSAGSGKTESVVFNFLKHFNNHSFCGVIHDYKHFEITEMAHPLFQDSKVPLYIVSFDDIFKRVNPIAPRYMEDEESVNEISRVLLENLLEQKESVASGSSKFFNDAVEGLLGGLIWKLKTSHPDYCTLPHLIATYQYLDTEQLVSFLSSDFTSKAMADAFISGIDSERQTAGVMSTLANALKKISTPRIFMTLSADEIPLDINNPKHPSVISVVNNPKFDTAYSPVIATIIHTITKQMSVRNRLSSFFLAEEASTFRLLNMQRIPATLRSYDIATVYVLQDKIQNDLMYGDKASKAILSNLTYQFFGKANDPDTAKYYERFFEIIKQPTRSISKSSNWNFDARITKGEKDVSKIRADVFFRLKRGEFIAFADGKDKRVKFERPEIKRELPKPIYAQNHPEIRANFQRIHLEVRRLFS
ncbi:type IV secretory system conjugative DNA transfer family protein [Euzebyella saccharophila]|uniref:Type IV secretory system conjugative DNA transfer family protein n=1 Tax=Euzebyella saccharophila TaxID=679664 RepID=A0ABV8JMP3_9FLAO